MLRISFFVRNISSYSLGAKFTESDRCLLNAMDRYDLELLSLRVMPIFPILQNPL
jgi:hypothetical protein